jgi:hypothetical protein
MSITALPITYWLVVVVVLQHLHPADDAKVNESSVCTTVRLVDGICNWHVIVGDIFKTGNIPETTPAAYDASTTISHDVSQAIMLMQVTLEQ